MEQYDVFISYRRDGGDVMAHIFYERLKERHYSVFQDIENLRAGRFNDALFEIIAACQDVILILPPNALDRCDDPDDWVRHEIAFALKQNKNIIPIMLRGFEWPAQLPADIDAIRFCNGLTANTEYFEQFLTKLETFLQSKPSAPATSTAKSGHIIRTGLIAGTFALLCAIPAVQILVFHADFGLFYRLWYVLLALFCARWVLNEIETNPVFAAKCFGTLKEDDLQQTVDEVYSSIVSVFGTDHLISRDIPEGFTSYYTLKHLEFGAWKGQQLQYLKVVFRRSLEYYDPSVLYVHALSKNHQSVKLLTKQGFVLQATPPSVDGHPDYLYKGNLHVFIYHNKRKIDRLELYRCSSETLKNRLAEKRSTTC